jgi:predicted enzyme related to lactoylglutathione lyase
MFLGLRTVVYYVSDIDKAKEFYNSALSITPYFDSPYYVGYNVAGYELGLHPGENHKAPQNTGAISYWGVENISVALKHLLEIGATLEKDIEDVGEGIKVASVLDPFGNVFGIIENPHFSLP